MLTDLQRNKLPNLFHLHDVDGDGIVRKSDFDQFAQRLTESRGLEANSSEGEELRSRFTRVWEGMRPMADAEQGSGLTLDGWFSFWNTALSTEGMYDEVASPVGEFVFFLLDEDGNGTVAFDEYMSFYDLMGLDRGVAERVFSKLDLNGDGSLSRDEISVLLEQYFCSDDPEAPGNWFFGPFQ